MIKQSILLVLGIFCLILGILGILIPLLPTTPLFLASAWLFARSSPRFHAWLLNHRIFGRSIRDYMEKKGIRRRVRFRALLFLWASLLLTTVLIRSSIITLMLIIIGILVTLHILTLKVLPDELSTEVI